jgi:hypothetical protein
LYKKYYLGQEGVAITKVEDLIWEISGTSAAYLREFNEFS